MAAVFLAAPSVRCAEVSNISTQITRALDVGVSGRYKESLASLKMLIEPCLKDLGRSATFAYLQRALGDAYFRTGDYKQAEICYQQSVDVYRKQQGIIDSDVAMALNGFALCKVKLGAYVSAEKIYREALTIATKDDTFKALVLTNLGTCLSYQGRNAEAEAALRGACVIYTEVSDDKDSRALMAFACLAEVVRCQGRTQEAISILKATLQKQISALGQNHPDVASTQGVLGDAYKDDGNLLEAKMWLKQSVAGRRLSLGSEHALTATTLVQLARVLQQNQEFSAAEDASREALEIRQKLFGADNPSTKSARLALASIYQDQGKFIESESLYLTGRTFKRQRVSNVFTRESRALRSAKELHVQCNKTVSPASKIIARILLEEHAEIETCAEKNENVPVSQLMSWLSNTAKLGTLYQLRQAELKLQMAISFEEIGGKVQKLTDDADDILFAAAESLTDGTTQSKRSPRLNLLNTLENDFGDKHTLSNFLASTLQIAGCLHGSNGNFAKAKKCFGLSEKCILNNAKLNDGKAPRTGQDAASHVESLLRLADYSEWLNDENNAARLIDLASSIANASGEPQLIFDCAIQTAELQFRRGLFEESLDNARNVLIQAKKLTTPNNLFRCYCLLSKVTCALNQLIEAKEFANFALAITPITDSQKSEALTTLYAVSQAAGDRNGAVKAIDAALKLSASTDNTSDQSIYANAAACFGLEALKQKKFDLAREKLTWAYNWDKKNPSIAGKLASARDQNGLALVEFLSGDNYLAQRYALHGSAPSMDKFIEVSFPQLSFNQQCAFVAFAKSERDVLMNVISDDSGSIDEAYTYMMKWKGLLLETLRHKTAMATEIANNPALKITSAELDDANKELSALTNSSGELNDDILQQLKTKSKQRDELEKKLLDRCSTKATDPIAHKTSKDFIALLKPDEAFLDIIPYRLADNSEDVYAAIALKQGEPPHFISLGKKSEIHELVTKWRTHVIASNNDRDVHVKQSASQLAMDASQLNEINSVSQDLSKYLTNNSDLKKFLGPSVTKIWLCPEGDFAKIPWSCIDTIAGTNGYSICEVDSPREFFILREPNSKKPKSPSVLLAGLSQFAPPVPPLSGAIAEITAIKPIADAYSKTNTTILPEEAATKQSVRDALGAATYVHIATHGFSNEASGAPDTRSLDVLRTSSKMQLVSATRNPLLDCGLLFALPHESRKDEQGMPNVLTAQEIVGLDLNNCDHITLSACQTGLGRDFEGQGTIGLRSSLMSAGAKSLLMSLWSVPDEATAELMKHFYTYLWVNKLPKTEALIRAQKDVRNDKSHDWKAPQFWAAWVVTGDGFASPR